MPSEAADKVLPAIHDAALDPRRWQAVAEALAAAGGCHGVHMLFFDTTNPGLQGCFQSGYAPEMIQSFFDHYGAINPWRFGLARHAPLTAVTSEQMLPHADLVKTEFHADWLRPQGDISAGAGMILQQDRQRILVMGGHIRMRDQDRLERPWQALAHELGPTLRHAVEVNRALAGLRLENGLLAQGVSPRDAAILVLSDDMRILFTNKAAERGLTEGACLRCDLWHRLRLCDPRAQEALAAALSRLRQRMPPAALHLTDPVTRAVRMAHLLCSGPEVLPFSGLDLVRGRIPESVAVLVVPAAVDGGVLMHAFGLTRAEAEVALALHAGRTLAEIASARKASIHTVRAQAKAILGKCGVRRQAELVALIGRMLRP